MKALELFKSINRLDEIKQGELEVIRHRLRNQPPEGNTVQWIIDWLEANGWEITGRGSSFAVVYQNPSSPYIIKIVPKLSLKYEPMYRCGIQWLRYSNKHWMENEHLPRVYYATTFGEEGTARRSYFVVMEKLEEYDSSLIYTSDDETNKLVAAVLAKIGRSEYLPEVVGRGMLLLVRDHIEELYAKALSRRLPLALAAEKIVEMDPSCSSDLHMENFMLRNGTIVITDPFRG